MAFFNFFGQSEHKVFDHKPIYYDEEKERRKKIFGKVDGSDKKDAYVPGSYIRGSLREGNYQNTRTPMKTVQAIIGIVSLLLIAGIVYFFLQLYPYLFR